jgi:CheY-like chemotaxis protein
MANERILIVEDDVALEGEPLAMNVQKAGYEVVGIAETEKDAVEMALRERPCVVLMDIQLVDAAGKKDSLAGLRAARQIRATTGAQVIFVTGALAESDVLSEAQKTPDHVFLVKPVTEVQLLTSIRLAVARTKRKGLVFVCYSREDIKFADEMMLHLRRLEGLGISPWIDSQIAPGQRWETEINRALAEAKAAICLVSPAFVNSEFVTKVELPALLKAEAERGLSVCPVYVNSVHEVILKPWGLLDFQGINRPENPIALWSPPRRHLDCWGALCKWLALGMGGSVQ